MTGMEGDDSYKTPRNFMLTGIAWYRLKNFELAGFNFDRVPHASASPGMSSTNQLRQQLVQDWQVKFSPASTSSFIQDYCPPSADSHKIARLKTPRQRILKRHGVFNPCFAKATDYKSVPR